MIAVTRMILMLCWGLFIAAWTVGALTVKRTAERPGFSLAAKVPLIAAAVIGLTMLWQGDGPLSALNRLALWPQTGVTGAVVDAFAVLGVGVALWARLALGRNWSADLVVKEQHVLVQGGPYAYVRHPIYTGVLLMLLGTAIHMGALSGLLVFGLCVAGFWLRARDEERLMMRQFPEAYAAYRRRVKALIPYVL